MKENLQHTMDGYCLDEPYFSAKLKENVTTLMRALKDPALPLLELQVGGNHVAVIIIMGVIIINVIIIIIVMIMVMMINTITLEIELMKTIKIVININDNDGNILFTHIA